MRLLHFADVHLGMTNFGRMDTVTGLHTRILDYLDALDFVVAAAEELLPDLIIFAGDAFRTRTPNPTLVTLFAERIQRLADVAPVLMIIGNHDRQRGGSSRAHSIDIMAELAAKHEIMVESGIGSHNIAGAYVVTLPWSYDLDLDDVCRSIDNTVSAGPGGVPYVLVGHVGVENATFDSGQPVGFGDDIVYPLSTFDVFDYSALGHIHRHQELSDNVVYCGSLERINWGERKGGKGFIVADVDIGHVKWTFVSTNPRPMVDAQTSWSDIDNITNVDVEDAIVRVTVDMPDSVSKSMVSKTVRALLPDDYYVLDRVNLVAPEDRRAYDQCGRNLEQLSAIELLEQYLEDKYPDDPEYVDTLYFAAEDLIKEADGEFSG